VRCQKETQAASGRLCSLTEEATEEEKIPVSSAILAAKSNVFFSMLTSGMAESDKDRPIIIKLSGPQGKPSQSP
jgi:hypothetical protein